MAGRNGGGPKAGNSPLRPSGAPPLDGHGFRRHLDGLDVGVRTLSALVIDGVGRSTEAFLLGDPSLARALAAEHQLVSSLPAQLEDAVSVDIARHSPVGSDLRFLISVLRIAPALGRCLELVDHVAERRWVGPLLPGEAALAFAEMSAHVTVMWEWASAAWREMDGSVAGRVDELADDVKVLVGGLPILLRQPDLTPLAAMQAVTVGRFFERLGDHAVDFAKRTQWNVTGGLIVGAQGSEA